MANELKPQFGGRNPALDHGDDSLTRELAAWIVGSILGIVIIYWLIGLAANFAAKKIPDSTETKLFNGMQAMIFSQLSIPSHETDTSEFLRAKKLLAQLTSSKKLRNLPFKLHYSTADQPNAFAIPGGSIAVTQGLLEIVKSDMGLAMVLAHELGHHQHRDPLRGMGRSLLVSVLASVLLGGNSGVTRLVIGFAESSYSRQQELDADGFGLNLLYGVYGTTEGALEFFEKIASGGPVTETRLTSMFSTHPYTPDRLQALRSLELKLNKSH